LIEVPVGESAAATDDDVKVGIGKLAANVKGLFTHVKGFTFQFGEEHPCTYTVRQEFGQQKGLVQAQRDQRRSTLSASVLRRRAEQIRDVTISKTERTTAGINEGLEQQAKPQARMDKLYAQRAQQGQKLTRLMRQVAEFAQDAVDVCPAAEPSAEPAAANARLAERLLQARAHTVAAKQFADELIQDKARTAALKAGSEEMVALIGPSNSTSASLAKGLADAEAEETALVARMAALVTPI
jgi:hypothetical protein